MTIKQQPNTAKVIPLNSTAAETNPVVSNPWRALQHFTDARIGLGRAGVSIPTNELLAFQLAHAQARDAVHLPLDVDQLRQQLTALAANLPPLFGHTLQSQASDRICYLQRPDLGRTLDQASRDRLTAAEPPVQGYDLALVIVDGLSSRAIQQNAAPFLHTLCDALAQPGQPHWSLAPICIVEQGRVAIGDEIGALLNARMVLILIGERPGLSSPDSLGLYLTWAPHRGLTDASRNCISNIRPAGLSDAEACSRTLYLLNEARRSRISGVQLKDRSDDRVIEQPENNKNLLICSTPSLER